MPTRPSAADLRPESTRIGPDDPRYRAVVDKRFNKRFSASPDYVRLVGTTDQAVSAVQEAVQEGGRLVVTSGGHCLEGFVADPDVRVIIDVSSMKRIYYDTEMGAVAVEAGATVGETFRRGGMELERHRPAVIPATPPESRALVRPEQPCRFPERLALDSARDPSRAVRDDHRPRREHGRRRRGAAGG